MKLIKYYDACVVADWYYSYSDDPGTYKRGQGEVARLEQGAKESTEHQALFDGFKKYHFSGKPFGTERTQQPERPEQV